jgi:alkanesulfonate monooxygenase SsuD/methylene tetrahydromethanopterin reductase-like flavin-dependent oxidoreductase (luciferase family)
MSVPVGLSVWSGLVGDTMPYLDQTAEPFDSLWFPDHVQYGDKNVAEGWSLLMFALARYEDKLCGHQVLCNSFRNPAHLAKMTATAQELSGGRVILGIGAGWNQEEYLAYGWPFPSAKVRIEQLDEAIQLIRAMWTGAPAHFQGTHYQIAGAYCEPRPDPVPEVMVGGAGEKYLMRVVAAQADWWNYIYQERAAYVHKQNVLKEHCRAVGRDYDTIKQSLAVHILIGETEAEVQRMQESDAVRPVTVNGMAGTPEQITEHLLAGVEQGGELIIVGFADSPRTEGTHLFAEEVLPHLAG